MVDWHRKLVELRIARDADGASDMWDEVERIIVRRIASLQLEEPAVPLVLAMPAVTAVPAVRATLLGKVASMLHHILAMDWHDSGCEVMSLCRHFKSRGQDGSRVFRVHSF